MKDYEEIPCLFVKDWYVLEEENGRRKYVSICLEYFEEVSVNVVIELEDFKDMVMEMMDEGVIKVGGD